MTALFLVGALVAGAGAVLLLVPIVRYGKARGTSVALTLAVCAIGAVVLSLVLILGAVARTSLFQASGTSRGHLFTAAIIGLGVTELVAFWRAGIYRPRQPSQRPSPVEPPTDLALSDMLTCLGFGAMAAAVAYIVWVPRLPTQGPLLLALLMIPMGIGIFAAGFVVGRIVWLAVAVRRYAPEQIEQVIGGPSDTDILARVSRAAYRFLAR